MPKPGQSPNIATPGLSEAAMIRAANSMGTANTPESSGQVMNANRLNTVPARSSEGRAAIEIGGRAPFPVPPLTP